jgi:hypothetical protein
MEPRYPPHMDAEDATGADEREAVTLGLAGFAAAIEVAQTELRSETRPLAGQAVETKPSSGSVP